ncbi:MAG: DUF4921 family protein [Acidimicrobiia bacterium]
MPERRYDPIHDRWVIVAADRAERPHTFRTMAPIEGDHDATCPFCPGNEAQTTPEVFRSGEGAPNSLGWQVRVFPNMYPVVGPDREAHPGDDHWRSSESATGSHEVVLMSPVHRHSLADLTDHDARTFFRVLRDRVRVHRDRGHHYSQVLINHGTAAGASIEHPHAQLISIDFVPDPIDQVAQQGANACGAVVAAARDHERAGALTVLTTDALVAWVPWASATPYVTNITPTTDCARFADADDGDVDAVALTCRELVRALRAELGEQPYNLLVMSAANGDDRPFQWYVEIQPRLGVLAGFELGAGVYVNIVPPEIAAVRLRAHLDHPAVSEH